MKQLEQQIKAIENTPRTWLVSGVAGFIGSNLLEYLLKHGQKVVGLDNFATGHQYNLDKVQHEVGADNWNNFNFIEGDICDFDTCVNACNGVDHVLHQAALGSVPRSIEDPIATNASNVTGFLHMLTAARDAGVKSFVYAASSSTYGDEPNLPKREAVIGNPLSPYAVTKYVNELYSNVFSRAYGFDSVGLRYFNVFGPRQDPNGAYAAVIPKWIGDMVNQEQIYINGKGDTSRDFCYVDNAVEANVLASLTENPDARGQVYNVALHEQTSLTELFDRIREAIAARKPELTIPDVKFQDYRAGDVLHSLADISKARELLGFDPSIRVDEGLELTVDWFLGDLSSK
jgi:UDP-N-acetylglucosamine 4-epimerase